MCSETDFCKKTNNIGRCWQKNVVNVEIELMSIAVYIKLKSNAKLVYLKSLSIPTKYPINQLFIFVKFVSFAVSK